MIEQPMSQERMAQIAFGIIGEHVEIERPAYQQQVMLRAGVWTALENTDWFYGPHGGSCMSIIARFHKRNPRVIFLMVAAQIIWTLCTQ